MEYETDIDKECTGVLKVAGCHGSELEQLMAEAKGSGFDSLATTVWSFHFYPSFFV